MSKYEKYSDTRLRECMKKLPKKEFTNWEFSFYKNVIVMSNRKLSTNQRACCIRLIERQDNAK